MTDVGQTFQQNEIFLTGGNGFLGKVILGLLLDRYPGLKHLHILVRPGKNTSAEKRFEEETLGSPALAPVVERLGRNFVQEKITVWGGDVSLPHCGLEPRALEELAGRVAAIINCAGLVDFFPPLDEAFRANVDGVEQVVALARQWRAKLAHVSTCFVCGAAEGLVEETEPVLGFYPRRQGREDESFSHTEEITYARERVRDIYDSSEANGGSGIAAASRSRNLAPRLISLGKQRAEKWGWVNTYTYSKSLGEQIIAAEPGLEYSLVRPAIVESALRFPFPGWLEGGRTSAPLVLMALGGLKEWPVRKDLPLEVVPVDLVASAILIVTALLLEGHSQRVYQLGSADVNPTILGSVVKWLDGESRRLQREKPNGKGGADFFPRLLGGGSGSKVRFLSAEQFSARRARQQAKIERTQAFLSGLSQIMGKSRLPGEPKLAQWSVALRTLSLQATFREQTINQYLPFIQDHRYIFESENIRAALSLITEKDRQLLPWDPERIGWKDYWISHQVAGTLKWIQPEAVRDWTFKI